MGNLKKSKKIIAFSAALVVLLGLTAGMTHLFSAEGMSTIPVITSAMGPDTMDDRPRLTWEAVKELAGGSLNYSDMRDTFYYRETGSGLYIVSFPIENAPEFSLLASSAGPNAAPMTVGLRCESEDLSLELNAENLGIMMDLYNRGRIRQDTDALTATPFNTEPPTSGKDDPGQDEADVRALTEAFGKMLRNVCLSAPKDMAAKSIEENYRDYVTPQLLKKWQADPQNAPGRLVSSPWPHRIDILRMEMSDKNRYTVYGEIIEVTSVELTSGGAAAKRPVEIEAEKAGDRWLIGSVTIGGYMQHGPVLYKNTRYGFCFYLPETWKGYSIVEEQWEGTSGANVIETGPQLLIRHPDWNTKTPRQDIPIMIFTLAQWNALQKGDFFVSAAPIGPGKLGGNSQYVFALPARYNFAFQKGFEEVEEILEDNPLWPSY